MQELTKTTQIHHISTSKIVPNPNQPRKVFSEDSIIKLANNIKEFGIIQPLTVREMGEFYELVAGERRLRAAKELNLPNVPCIIADVNEEKSAEISIIENLLREDLNIFEEAAAIDALLDTYGLTQEKVAEKLSVSQSYVANKLRLLRFSKEEQSTILQNNLTERHARALLRISDAKKRETTLNTIVNEQLNVAQAEILVERALCTDHTKAQKSTNESRQYKDTHSFCSAINRALEQAKSSNLDIKTRKIVGETFTEITIIVPNARTDNTAFIAELGETEPATI